MKINGYVSVILIIFISIISISLIYLGLNSYQNSMILNNEISSSQGKYISESYLLKAIDDIKNKKSKDDKNLFPDLSHDKVIEISDLDYNDIPCNKIKVTTDYEDIETCSEAILSKYNKIFYYNQIPITKDNLPEKYFDAFNDFSNSVNEKLEYVGEINPIIIENQSIVNERGNLFVGEYFEEEFVPIIQLDIPMIVELGNVEIGGYEHRKNINLYGNFYLNGNIDLMTNLTIKGLIISNGGQINTNGYSCRIEGGFVEIGENGSYPNVDFIYNKKTVNSTIMKIENARRIEELSIIINK